METGCSRRFVARVDQMTLIDVKIWPNTCMGNDFIPNQTKYPGLSMAESAHNYTNTLKQARTRRLISSGIVGSFGMKLFSMILGYLGVFWVRKKNGGDILLALFAFKFKFQAKNSFLKIKIATRIDCWIHSDRSGFYFERTNRISMQIYSPCKVNQANKKAFGHYRIVSRGQSCQISQKCKSPMCHLCLISP